MKEVNQLSLFFYVKPLLKINFAITASSVQGTNTNWTSSQQMTAFLAGFLWESLFWKVFHGLFRGLFSNFYSNSLF